MPGLTLFRRYATCLQIVAAPNAEILQVQAAQDLKKLSDRVANARGDSRGKRLAKGQAAAAASSRVGRIGRGKQSKSPPPPSSAALPVKSNGGKQRRHTIGGNNSSSDSSSQNRRISRNDSGKRSSSSKPAKQEVAKSAREAGEGKVKVNHAQTHQAEALSEIATTPPSNEQAAAEGMNIAQSAQKERSTSPREGTTPEEMKVADAAFDTGVVGDGQHDDAATNSKEVVRDIGRAPDDDAAEASPATETNQQQIEAPEIEEALPTSTPTATEVETPLASPVLPEETSRITLLRQDEGGNDPVASLSSTTESVHGQAHHQQEEEEQRQNQPTQRSDSTPAAFETVTTIAPPSMMVTEEQGQDRETTSEEIFKISPKISPVGDKEQAGMVDDMEGENRGGRVGPETEGPQQPDATAVIEFVPTERSLAAYCQV